MDTYTYIDSMDTMETMETKTIETLKMVYTLDTYPEDTYRLCNYCNNFIIFEIGCVSCKQEFIDKMTAMITRKNATMTESSNKPRDKYSLLNCVQQRNIFNTFINILHNTDDIIVNTTTHEYMYKS
jgi:hypothetical protein